MTAPLEPDPQSAFKTLWGASQPPFTESVTQPYESKTFGHFRRQLQQLVAVRACGVVHGPSGVGKTLLVQHLLATLPEKRFKPLLLSHSSVTASDLLRLLCGALECPVRMKRSDNVSQLHRAWQQLDRLWPVLVLDEAQDYGAGALEEVRLLTCNPRDTQPPFSLILVGDEQLLPRLQMGINAPLLGRLSFSLHLPPWTLEDLHGYLQARLQAASIHAMPFEEPALRLLLQAANGRPRLVNHLAQRALEAAAAQNLRSVAPTHVQSALELMPWLAKL